MEILSNFSHIVQQLCSSSDRHAFLTVKFWWSSGHYALLKPVLTVRSSVQVGELRPDHGFTVLWEISMRRNRTTFAVRLVLWLLRRSICVLYVLLAIASGLESLSSSIGTLVSGDGAAKVLTSSTGGWLLSLVCRNLFCTLPQNISSSNCF